MEVIKIILVAISIGVFGGGLIGLVLGVSLKLITGGFSKDANLRRAYSVRETSAIAWSNTGPNLIFMASLLIAKRIPFGGIFSSAAIIVPMLAVSIVGSYNNFKLNNSLNDRIYKLKLSVVILYVLSSVMFLLIFMIPDDGPYLFLSYTLFVSLAGILPSILAILIFSKTKPIER